MVYTDGIHLTADTLRDLHAMAGQVGLGPWWFHNGRHPHYDLYRDRELRAMVLKKVMERGVRLMTSRELVRISLKNQLI